MRLPCQGTFLRFPLLLHTSLLLHTRRCMQGLAAAPLACAPPPAPRDECPVLPLSFSLRLAAVSPSLLISPHFLLVYLRPFMGCNTLATPESFQGPAQSISTSTRQRAPAGLVLRGSWRQRQILKRKNLFVLDPSWLPARLSFHFTTYDFKF